MVTGFTTGCFDLFHVGHLVYLQRCRALCDRLIVGVDSDKMVRKAKGPQRPIVPEIERFDLINNLSVVHSAFIMRDLSEVPNMVRKYEVTKVFKHQSFWGIKHVVGVEGTGAELVIIPDIPGMVSTSELIKRVLNRYRSPSANVR